MDEYRRDVVAIRSGEKWRERLPELIEEADVFQLFWSSNSMRSRYCQEEWEHALALGRPSFVRPFYWEDPRPQDRANGLPPAALDTLQFVKVSLSRQAAPILGYPAAQPYPAARPDWGSALDIPSGGGVVRSDGEAHNLGLSSPGPPITGRPGRVTGQRRLAARRGRLAVAALVLVVIAVAVAIALGLLGR